MPDGALSRPTGRIGPNAVLQLVTVLDDFGGRRLRDRVLAAGGLFEVPSDAGLMPELPAALVHQAVRRDFPAQAPALLTMAGRLTAEYILAHRIPPPAQRLLRALPAPLAAPLLSRAIARHAWTFAGSGRFARSGAWHFEIAENPIVAGETADCPVCHWHVAVFETLYRRLVHPRASCRETACSAAGDGACRFVLRVAAAR